MQILHIISAGLSVLTSVLEVLLFAMFSHIPIACFFSVHFEVMVHVYKLLRLFFYYKILISLIFLPEIPLVPT